MSGECPGSGTSGRTSRSRRQLQLPARLHECACVLLPRGLVEVDRQEEARLVEEQWIHAGHEHSQVADTRRDTPVRVAGADRVAVLRSSGMVDQTGLSWNHLGGVLVEAKALWAQASAL
jgi:hypothetical protein